MLLHTTLSISFTILEAVRKILNMPLASAVMEIYKIALLIIKEEKLFSHLLAKATSPPDLLHDLFTSDKSIQYSSAQSIGVGKGATHHCQNVKV
jgi:hypothetical protein